MPSLEHFIQPRLFDAPHTDHGELAAQPPTSPRMEQVVTHLAAAQGVDLSQKGTTFSVESPDQPGSRWQMSNIDGERIGVTRLQVDEASALSPDIDMVFAVTEYGWEPREIVHAERPWDEFARAAEEQELTAFDENGNLRYDVFAEVWAEKIEQYGGLEQARDKEVGKARLTSQRDENAIKKARRDLWEATGHIPAAIGGAPDNRTEAQKQFNWKRDLSENAQKLYYWLMLNMGDTEYLPLHASKENWDLDAAISEIRGWGRLDESDPTLLKLKKRQDRS